MKLTYIMLIALALSGCAGEAVILKNDLGNEKVCSIDGVSKYLYGAIVSYNTVKSCITTANREGYK